MKKTTTKLSLTIILTLVISLVAFTGVSSAKVYTKYVNFRDGSVTFGAKGQCKKPGKQVVITLSGAGHSWKAVGKCLGQGSKNQNGNRDGSYAFAKTIRPSASVYKDLKKAKPGFTITGPGQPY